MGEGGWYAAFMEWWLILLVFLALEHLTIIWWVRKTNRQVNTLHWRLDSIWRKNQIWHSKVDQVTGQVRRMTGDDWEEQHVENEEEFDDVDRDADTQPRSAPQPKRRRKTSGKKGK